MTGITFMKLLVIDQHLILQGLAYESGCKYGLQPSKLDKYQKPNENEAYKNTMVNDSCD